jgi:hypothetical protein
MDIQTFGIICVLLAFSIFPIIVYQIIRVDREMDEMELKEQNSKQ